MCVLTMYSWDWSFGRYILCVNKYICFCLRAIVNYDHVHDVVLSNALDEAILFICSILIY